VSSIKKQSAKRDAKIKTRKKQEKERKMIEKYRLRDEQWERIKDLRKLQTFCAKLLIEFSSRP